MRYILALILFATSTGSAQAELKIVYEHVCPDGYNLCTYRYTQAAPYIETERQVKRAIKNAKHGSKLTYYSIDPIYRGDEWNNYQSDIWNDQNGLGSWEYGAYYCKGRILVSIMAKCPNIRILLERLLRDLKNGKAVNSCPRKTKYQASLYEYLANPELFPSTR